MNKRPSCIKSSEANVNNRQSHQQPAALNRQCFFEDKALAPGGNVRLSEPMPDDAQYVGVVAFFRNQTKAEWQLVMPKAQWKKTDPVKVTVTDNRLELEATH